MKWIIIAVVIILLSCKIQIHYSPNKKEEPKWEPSHYPPEPKPPWIKQEVYDEYIKGYNTMNGYPEDTKWWI